MGPKRVFFLFFVSISLLFVGCASFKAPETLNAQAGGDQVTIFKNVKVIDGVSDRPIDDAFLVINGTTIAKLTTDPRSLHEFPKAKIIDGTGKVIIPGLISGHVHLGTLDAGFDGLTQYNVQELEAQLAIYIRYGVTTIASLGVNGDVVYNLKKRVAEGRLLGPDILSADRGFGVFQGAPGVKENASGARVFRPSTVKAVHEQIQNMATRPVDLVKLWYDDNLHSMPKMSPEIYQAIIHDSHAHQWKVAAHVYYLNDAKDLLKAGVDLLAHGIREGHVDAEFIRLMQQNHRGYIPTLSLDEAFFALSDHPHWLLDSFFTNAVTPQVLTKISQPEFLLAQKQDPKLSVRRKALETNKKNLKKLFDEKVLIGFGTDSGALITRVPGFNEHRELQLMSDAGIPNLEIIRIATSNTAHILGLTDRGQLRSGYLADFVVLDADPSTKIENSKRIQQVWKRGRLVFAAQTK